MINEQNTESPEDNGFCEWWYELQGFGHRCEYFSEAVDMCTDKQDSHYTWSTMKRWILAAYDAGYQAGYDKGISK